MPPKKRKSDVLDEVEEKKGKKGAAANGRNSPANFQFDPDADEGSRITLSGSLLSGEVLMCGGTNWDMIGRKDLPKGVKNLGGRNLWGPHRISSLMGIKVRTVASGCTACHSLIITNEGLTYSFGRNDRGQLGMGDLTRRDTPTIIPGLKELKIVEAACGKCHTQVVTELGHVYAFGENKVGQLGIGQQSNYIPNPTRVHYKGPPIRRVACGVEFTMLLDVRGQLYSVGCPEYGQLGHNSDGKYFVTSSKMGFRCELRPRPVMVYVEKFSDGQIKPVQDVEITDIACGQNHTLAVDRKKRLYSWGFGGYGRLGHNEPKDEMVPRLLKVFDGPNRGATVVNAGSTFSLAVNEVGCLMYWGQTRPTGEATMYPKPVHDLNGWKIRSVGACNRSIVVAADESLVSWGPSPTYGELGYGDNKPKSSSYPQEVKALKDTHIHQVGCGFGHALLIIRNDTDEEKQKIDTLPEYEPPR